MSRNRRELIIEDIITGAKFPGLLKKARWQDSSIKPYQVFLISNIFNGSHCYPNEREGFSYSWILTERDKSDVEEIDLDVFKNFSQNDWHVDFPSSVIGSRKISKASIYKIYFKANCNFEEIVL